MFLNAGRLSIVISFTAALMISVTGSPVSAQEKAGEVLQQMERKELLPPRIQQIPVIEQPGRQQPQQPAATGARIYIKKIKVTVRNKSRALGEPLISNDEIRGITSGYENKKLTMPEINQIAEAITAAYRAKGYILGYAYIAAQEIKDGVLEIGIMEGTIGEISVKGNTSYSDRFIRKHIEAIQDDPALRERTLERALLLLNDYPSLNVKASLKAGKKFGETDITAVASDKMPVFGSLSYDNFGSKTTSKNRLGAELNIGNLLVSGDLLMLRGLIGLDKVDLKNLSYGRAEYVIPLGYRGTKMGLYYTNSVFEAGGDYYFLDINGKANVAGIYLSQAFVRTKYTSLDAKLGFEYKDVYDYMLENLRSKDKIRALNLGVTCDFIDRLYGRNILSLTGYLGLGELLGGNEATDTNVSRLNADRDFTKFKADVERVQKLPGYNHLILKGSGQYSEDNLYVAEQFLIGGVGSVRGFASSTRSGDKGYFASAELYLSPVFPEASVFNQKLGDTVKFVFFADHGGVFRNDIQPGEDKYDYMTSMGAGVRLYATRYFSARLDYAVPDIDGVYDTKNSETYVQAQFNF